MGRMSAKFIAQKLVNFSTSDVYEVWKDMGFVIKDKFGEWVLTELGRSNGGKISKSGYSPVPTFDVDKIIDMMIKFCEKHNK